MVLLMARPTKRTGSINHQFRRRVPADVLKVARGQRITFSLPKAHTGDDRILVPAMLGSEVVFSLRTDDTSLVILRHAAATEQFERACSAFREGPQRLTHQQRVALAGKLYREFEEFAGDPGEPEIWELVKQAHDRANRDPVQREQWFGPSVDDLLLREGIVTDRASRAALIEETYSAMNQAAGKLHRNAKGDFKPDPDADRFPEWVGNHPKTAKKTSSLTFDELLTRWEKEGEKAASSQVSFQAHVAALEAHLGHNDAQQVTRADVIAWKDALIDRGLSAKTINDSYLASIRTLYNVAKRNDLIANNPVEGVGVPQTKKAGKSKLPYDDDEVAAILALANAETASHLNWIPWLLAFTGARVGEITQLWGQHVEEVDGIHVIQITPTPDGGTIKTASSERKIPIHPALIDRGFIEFVATRNGGPLFYGGKDAKPSTRKSKTAGHASDGPINRVREWIRGNGFTDLRKAPNHAFRHWFKTKCSDLDIADSVADAIQGHSDQSAAGGYRKISISKMAEAINKIPVPMMRAKSS